MKFGLARQHYREFSGLTSTTARQLAFAGIAAIWIFRPTSASGLGLPAPLLFSLAGLASFLLLDLMQYVYATAAWGIFQFQHEPTAKQSNPANEEEGEVPDSPDHINIATLVFFWLKIPLLLCAHAIFVWWLISESLRAQ